MKKIIFLLSSFLFLVSCGSSDDAMYCTPLKNPYIPDEYIVSNNGEYIFACSPVGEHAACGYRIDTHFFYCDSCDPIECEAAAERAFTYCFGHPPNNPDERASFDGVDLDSPCADKLLDLIEDFNLAGEEEE